jgi:hypothetical protein
MLPPDTWRQKLFWLGKQQPVYPMSCACDSVNYFVTNRIANSAGCSNVEFVAQINLPNDPLRPLNRC